MVEAFSHSLNNVLFLELLSISLTLLLELVFILRFILVIVNYSLRRNFRHALGENPVTMLKAREKALTSL